VVAASDIPEVLYLTLLGILLWDSEEGNREAAKDLVDGIGIKNIPESRGWLESLDNLDVDVRCAAVEVLGKFGELAVEPLIKALGDPSLHQNYIPLHGYDDYTVCEAAACTLGKIGDERAVEPLIELLEDNDYGTASSDWFIYSSAAYALGEIGDARAVGPLISMLLEGGDEGKHVHRVVEGALEMIGKPAVEDIITALEEDWGNHIRLVETGDKTYLIIENRGAFGNGDMISETILRVLWNIGEPAAEPLVNALTGTRGDVRVLGEFDDARTIEPFIQVLGDGIDD
jgi:hypothetical protein